MKSYSQVVSELLPGEMDMAKAEWKKDPATFRQVMTRDLPPRYEGSKDEIITVLENEFARQAVNE